MAARISAGPPNANERRIVQEGTDPHMSDQSPSLRSGSAFASYTAMPFDSIRPFGTNRQLGRPQIKAQPGGQLGR